VTGGSPGSGLRVMLSIAPVEGTVAIDVPEPPIAQPRSGSS